MNYRSRPPFLANSFGKQEAGPFSNFLLDSPARQNSASNSLSLSFSNQKNSQPDTKDKRQIPPPNNKENQPKIVGDDDIDLYSLQKRQIPDAPNSQLNEELAMLQGKLNNLEERFLHLTTPPKVKKVSVKQTKRSQQQHQSMIGKISNYQSRKPINDNTVKRNGGVTGKIQSTTRFSVMEKKPSDTKVNKFQRPLSRESHYSGSQNISVKSLRSLERSKNQQINSLKLQVSKCKNECDVSRRSKEKVEKQLTTLKEAVKQYRILEKRQKQMMQENLRLAKQLKRSEVIRERQKRVIEQLKKEIKQKECQHSTKRNY